MFEIRLSIYLNCFTFGSRPRRIFYAVIVEGLSLLGLLSFTPRGLLDLRMVPKFTQGLTFLAVVAVFGTYYVSRSAAKESFSPILHTRFIPGLITIGYLTLGLVATSIGYLVHVEIYQISSSLSLQEFRIGICIGLIFGFLILFYYDRYEIKAPGNYYRFEDASEKMLEDYRFLETSNLPPINLTGRYKALENSVRETAEILEDSATRDGTKLAQDMNTWVDEFSSKPEPAKGQIVNNSGIPQEKELKNLRCEFNSVIKRILKIHS